jgi:hypothetical protein
MIFWCAASAHQCGDILFVLGCLVSATGRTSGVGEPLAEFDFRRETPVAARNRWSGSRDGPGAMIDKHDRQSQEHDA